MFRPRAVKFAGMACSGRSRGTAGIVASSVALLTAAALLTVVALPLATLGAWRDLVPVAPRAAVPSLPAAGPRTPAAGTAFTPLPADAAARTPLSTAAAAGVAGTGCAAAAAVLPAGCWPNDALSTAAGTAGAPPTVAAAGAGTPTGGVPGLPAWATVSGTLSASPRRFPLALPLPSVALFAMPGTAPLAGAPPLAGTVPAARVASNRRLRSRIAKSSDEPRGREPRSRSHGCAECATEPK
jgi:hypothetical protein